MSNSVTLKTVPTQTGNFGSWQRKTTDEAQRDIRSVTDVDDTTDGLYKLQSPNNRSSNTDTWHAYYQWTTGNTQHTLSSATYSWTRYRKRTRTSANAPWGSWSSWGNVPNEFVLTDYNDVNEDTKPKITAKQSTVKNRFSRGGLQAYVYESRWFVFNEHDTNGNWTKQIAYKFYRDAGYNG